MRLSSIGAAPSPPLAASSRRSIPFDYSFRFSLAGRRDQAQSATVTVSVEATFVAVSVGYGVIARPEARVIGLGATPVGASTLLDVLHGLVGFAGLSPARFRERLIGLLKSGVRLNPEVADAVTASLTAASPRIHADLLPRLLQEVPPDPERVRFLYALFDEGSGREFQSEPILNTAGLGAADGGRPFRYFARPIAFPPRSTIRMQVIEKSDAAGDLHVSLHGYKVLGGAGSPTARTQRVRGSRGR